MWLPVTREGGALFFSLSLFEVGLGWRYAGEAADLQEGVGRVFCI